MNGDLINVSIIKFLHYNHFTNRAMRILLFLTIILLSSCASVEVAKELTKASKSIKTSVSNLVTTVSSNDDEGINKNTTDDKQIIDQKLANLEIEKKEKEKIIVQQKKEAKINFIGKTPKEINLLIQKPELVRIDGNSKTIRFDNNYCRLFLFSNSNIENSKIKYFEIRDTFGKLIINKDKIKKCYTEFKLI